jgi:hypothetical protein
VLLYPQKKAGEWEKWDQDQQPQQAQNPGQPWGPSATTGMQKVLVVWLFPRGPQEKGAQDLSWSCGLVVGTELSWAEKGYCRAPRVDLETTHCG